MTPAERLFPDGYCDCRCGPVHHRLLEDMHARELELICTYHRRTCARLDVRDLMGMGATEAYKQLEPMVGHDRAFAMTRTLARRSA